MLALFTENFDYQDIRVDFFQGISGSEILSYQFSIAILGEQINSKDDAGPGRVGGFYFSVVNSIFALMVASRDILQRWCYPLVPDIPISCFLQKGISLLTGMGGNSPPLSTAKGIKSHPSTKKIHYGQGAKLRRYGTCIAYVGERVSIGAGVRFEGHVLIGPNSTISSGVVLIDCVVGAGTVLDANAMVKNSIIFSSADSSCRIGMNALIQGSLLAPGTVVAAGIRTTTGTILGTWADFGYLYLEHDLKSNCQRWISSELLSIESSMKQDGGFRKLNHPSICMFISSDEEEGHHQISSRTIIPWNATLGNRLRSALKRKKLVDSFDTQHESGGGRSSHKQSISDDEEDENDESNDEYGDSKAMDVELSRSTLFKNGDWLTLSEPLFFSTKKAPWIEDKFANQNSCSSPDSLSSIRGKPSSSAVSFSTMVGTSTSSPPSSTTTFKMAHTTTPAMSQHHHPQFSTEIAETLKHALDYVAETDDGLSSSADSSFKSAGLQAFVENTCLEINALKFAFNANFLDVRRAVIPVLVRHSLSGEGSSKIQQVSCDWD